MSRSTPAIRALRRLQRQEQVIRTNTPPAAATTELTPPFILGDAAPAPMRGAWEETTARALVRNVRRSVALVYEAARSEERPELQAPGWQAVEQAINQALRAQNMEGVVNALKACVGVAAAGLGLTLAEFWQKVSGLVQLYGQAAHQEDPPIPQLNATSRLVDLVDRWWEERAGQESDLEALCGLTQRLSPLWQVSAQALDQRLRDLRGRRWQRSLHWQRTRQENRDVLAVRLAAGAEHGTWRLIAETAPDLFRTSRWPECPQCQQAVSGSGCCWVCRGCWCPSPGCSTWRDAAVTRECAACELRRPPVSLDQRQIRDRKDELLNGAANIQQLPLWSERRRTAGKHKKKVGGVK
jgi:hypothetical protein